MNDSLKIREAALTEYLDECSEMIERFSKNLSIIELGQTGKDTLAAIYRDIHTIKGSSQLFGFSQVGQLAHAMESCLDPVRKEKAQVLPALVDCLYAGLDLISKLLQGIKATKQEPSMQIELTQFLPRLVAIAELSLSGLHGITKDKIPGADPSHSREQMMLIPELPAIKSPPHDLTRAEKMHEKEPPDNPGFGIFDDPLPVSQAISPPPPQGAAAAPGPTALPAKPNLEALSKALQEDPHAETIRVHVSLLDNLMNLVGELVLIRNQLLQHAKINDSDGEFSKVSQRLNILTAELQNDVMKTRMQPIGNILNKFTRVARDMGRDLGKKIELDLQGADTELDKTIIEAVKDPLTHIVRNAIDHGIEMPAQRQAAGKPESGQIRLKAYHESGQVIIEVIDDGRGLDRHIIGAKAIEKGLITADALAKMSDREVQFLIFSPGFSTTAAVSNISGRGVGMDVVLTNVERIGGVVDLISKAGVGTTIKLKIPLTLAIVTALIVRTAQQRFAIPQSKLVELLRIDAADSSGEKIEWLQGRPVLRLRGHLLPLVKLTEILAGTDQAASLHEHGSMESAILNIVVLNADSFQFGLIVDEIEDSADIVVKSLAQFLKDLTLFSGATIMGDGAVALSIDVMGIAATAQLVPATLEAHSNVKNLDSYKTQRHQAEPSEYILIGVGAPGSYAIPLTLVSRLEEFDSQRFELSGEQKVIHYRDSLLPIFSLKKFLNLPFELTPLDPTRCSVVVIQRGERYYGIEVDEIQDMLSVAASIDQTMKDRPGILGALVAQDKVIVVVDILGMIDSLKSKFDAKTPSGLKITSNPHLSSNFSRQRHRILIVEDSSFFRNYIRQVLVEAGFKVELAVDGVEGLASIENANSDYFSMVISDIEMPNMNGLELARAIRKNKKFSQLPLLAVTTHFTPADIEEGRQAGFASYLEKLNTEKLIHAIDQLLDTSAKESKLASNS